MNAEFMGGEAIGLAALGAGAGAEGMERSRRSPRPEEDGAGWDGAGAEKAEKPPPRPLDGLVVRFVYDGVLGLESKKLPPPPNMLEEEAVVGGDFVPEKLSRPEKGDALGAGCAGWLNDKLLKASFMPPKPDC